MNWSRITSFDAWKGVAIESLWKIRSKSSAKEFNSNWPLNVQEAEQISVLWPTKYQWGEASGWVDPLCRGFRKYVHVEPAQIEQNYEGIVLVQISIAGKKHNIAIDYSDRSEIDEECTKICSLYFKMQFSRSGYAAKNVVPGGFIPFKDDIYTYLPHVRALADKKRYQFDVYGRFGLEFAKDTRRKACSMLANQSHFRWEGSFQVKRYAHSLWEIAHSKVCIDLPGNGDFCFRLIDYLAVGACVIGPKHQTQLHIPLVDGTHIAYTKNDLSDLVDLCRFYLDNDSAREAMRINARSFFDKYLHCEQLAKYYLRSCIDFI